MSQAGVEPAPAVQGIQVLRTETLPGVTFYRGTEVNHRYPRHWHDEVHVCKYHAGTGYLRYKGNSYQSCPGDLAVTAPGEVHENWVVPGASVSFRSVYIPVPLIHSAFQQLGTKQRELTFGVGFSQTGDAGPRLLAAYQAIERAASTLVCEELWLGFLLSLVRQCSDSGTAPASIRQDQRCVRKVREYIDAHFTRSISMCELSGAAGLSMFHLHRLFRASTGIPPHEYQTQLRINYAKRLLQRGCRPVDVALSSGFSDQSHLTRHFKRLVGITPARFSA